MAMRMGALPYLNSVEVGKKGSKSCKLTKTALMIQDLHGEHIPLSTQSLSCWLLSPWMPIAGHLQQENPMNSLPFRPKRSNHDTAKQVSLPIPTHPPGEIVTPFLGLHKNNGLVLLLAHDFLQQAHQSEKGQVRHHAFHHTTNETKLSMSPALTCLPFRRHCKRRQSVGCCGWR